MQIGDFAKVVGLKHDNAMNGRYVEILTDLETKELPNTDGKNPSSIPRHGIELVTDPETNGYISPDNLTEVSRGTPARRRAIWIHETGTEGPGQ